MSGEEQAVTIVVPAFNVGRYLPSCLDSILAQTDAEACHVLVVDDGSTDDTPAIADLYADRNDRVAVLHQPNAGPGAGAARNRGLDQVGTGMVLFLDGDDELTPTAIERLRTGLLRHGLDVAVGATEQFPEPRQWPWSGYFQAGTSGVRRIEDLPLLVHDARSCNKLYRTAWLRDQGLRFAEGIHHQDTVVNVPAMLLTERLLLVGDVVHRYRKRAEGGSVMDNHFTRIDNYWDHLLVIEQLNHLRSRLGPGREPLLQAFIARSFQGFSWRAPRVLPRDRLEEFFDRAAAVVGTLDPGVIESATRDASERVAYVAMREGDIESFRRLDDVSRRLVAHGGHLHLGVPASGADLDLLRAGRTRALVADVFPERPGIRIEVRLRIRGTTDPGRGVDRTTVRGLRDGDPAFDATVEWVGTDATESLGRALVPWHKLDAGTYQLRLQFHTDTGLAARWLRPAGDAPGSDPVRPDRHAVVSLGSDIEGHATLGVAPTLRWRLRRRLAHLWRRLRASA